MEVAEHRFLRHAETRFLQLLPVVERFLEQLPALLEFFQTASFRLSANKVSSIRERLLKPSTKCDALFLQSTLSSLNAFVLLFQRVGLYCSLLNSTGL